MGILWLTAPQSRQSEDVWPPSESIPAGKMNYTEKKSRAILQGDDGRTGRWGVEKKKHWVGDKEVKNVFLFSL